jgi:hypothetical protein
MKTIKLIANNIFFILLTFSLTTIPFNSKGQLTDIREIQVIGGNVQFIVNTLPQYTGGIDFAFPTTLTFKFNVEGSGGYVLQLQSSDSEIMSVDGNPNIGLDSLQIAVSSITVTGDVPTYKIPLGTVPVSNAPLTLVEGAGGTAHTDLVTGELVFSYKLLPMINHHEGFYYVELLFKIVPK